MSWRTVEIAAKAGGAGLGRWSFFVRYDFVISRS